MEIETDKAVVEVPSSVSGVVNAVKVKEGEKLKVGQVIFTLQGAAPSQAEAVLPAEPAFRGARLGTVWGTAGVSGRNASRGVREN